jgi:hypothetical protein
LQEGDHRIIGNHGQLGTAVKPGREQVMRRLLQQVERVARPPSKTTSCVESRLRIRLSALQNTDAMSRPMRAPSGPGTAAFGTTAAQPNAAKVIAGRAGARPRICSLPRVQSTPSETPSRNSGRCKSGNGTQPSPTGAERSKPYACAIAIVLARRQAATPSLLSEALGASVEERLDREAHPGVFQYWMLAVYETQDCRTTN